MQQSKSAPIQIQWRMQYPPIQPKTWHRWTMTELTSGIADLTKARGSEVLEFFLSRAFHLNLDRHTGWDLTELGSYADSGALGATIFRRGVAYRVGGSQDSLLKSGNYWIEFCQNVSLEKRDECFYVIDSGIPAELLPAWTREADAGVRFTPFESVKNMETVRKFTAEWLRLGRKKHWIIVGGGICSDTAAFAADLAGCSFELYPSTLLAMVDACVGGKTGVNFPPYGKNQLGTFAFPTEVTVCLQFLDTLTDEEFRCGVAEAIKHAILARDAAKLSKLAKSSASANRAAISEMLVELISVKSTVVEIDPDERGQRATLNLGHTLAHALEALAANNGSGEADQIRHGYAVALGLAFVTKVSMSGFGLHKETGVQILSALKSSGCILSSVKLRKGLALKGDDDLIKAWPRISALTTQDKKSQGGLSEWVVLTRNGEILRGKLGSWTNQVSSELLADAWKWLITWIDGTDHQL